MVHSEWGVSRLLSLLITYLLRVDFHSLASAAPRNDDSTFNFHRNDATFWLFVASFPDNIPRQNRFDRFEEISFPLTFF
jgi:hypothetical protein